MKNETLGKNVLSVPQCGNFRFYVKSVLESSKTSITNHFKALNFIDLLTFSLRKVQISEKSKFKASKCAKMVDFAILESRKPKIDFT